MKRQCNYMVLFCCAALMAVACKTKVTPETGDAAVKDTVARTAAAPVQQQAVDDEQQFDDFFDRFCNVVQKNDREAVGNMLYFPFLTARFWVNEELKSMELDRKADLVSRKEFGEYYERIFHPDVKRLLPGAEGEELAEIDSNTRENYYILLRRETDPGSKMYEVYVQFAEEGRSTESYFAFVFGKVKGQYKALSYYAKWPVKG